MSDIKEIINILKDYKVGILVKDEKIKLINLPENFPSEYIQEIKLRKSEIIAFYKESDNQLAKDLIPPVAHQDQYVVSGAQRRLWVLSQLEEGSIAYNMPFTFSLEGDLNIKSLERALISLIDRHESLRTVFVDVNGEVYQKILQTSDIVNVFSLLDLKGDASDEQKIKELLEKEMKSSFNLSSGPLLRLTVLSCGANKNILLFNMHHIISDGWSIDVIVRDLMQLYQAHCSGKDKPLEALKTQYKDYASWYSKQYDDDRLRVHREYWGKQFEGEMPVLDFPTDRPRPKNQTFNGDKYSFEIDGLATKRIMSFCHRENVTLFMALVAFVKTLLYRYTGQNDIVVGVPVAGREHAGLEDQVGFYVNTLALRTKFEENSSFRDLLSNMKETTLGGFEHQLYGFDKLVEDLKIKRDLSRSPLFDVMVVLQNTGSNSSNLPKLKDLQIKPYEIGHVVSKFDATFNFTEIDGRIRCDIEYNTDLFDADRFQRLSGHLLNIIETATDAPEARINEFDILTAEERRQIDNEFNATESEFPKERTVIHLLEESVGKYPDNTAIVHGEEELTYRGFYKKVLSLSNAIKGQGIGREDVVALIADRSVEMVVAIYAIMRSGAAYLPIDPDYPAGRIDYIVGDSGAKLIITNRQGAVKVQSTPIIDLSTFSYLGNVESSPVVNRPEDLAYVIYTSGSTGRPKGVMIEHHSLANIIQYLQNKYPLTSEDSYLFKTTYTFDVSVAEIFGWFLEGGKLAVLRKDGERDPLKIIDTINRNNVTHVNFVPSMFSAFLESLGNQLEENRRLKYFFLAGEALPAGLVKKFKGLNTKIKIENIYGPTESTIYACGYSLDSWTDGMPVYIGKPVDNIKLFVSNKNNELQPVGVPGELVIAGEGIARGYLKNSSLNQEKFIKNGFGPHNAKAYKTGDLARLSKDGNIEYLGRIDNQIKVRGYRIELGEIERCIEDCSGVLEAVVNVIGDSVENKRIVGYFKSNKDIRPKEIKSNLLEKLPVYMLPDVLMRLDQFPKTSSGKIDRKELPLPELNRTVDRIAPRNETEEKLIGIWSEVLGLSEGEISIDDNFFELGGHSLKVIRLVNKINDVFRFNFSLKEVFDNQTVEKIAGLINLMELSSNCQVIEQDPGLDNLVI